MFWHNAPSWSFADQKNEFQIDYIFYWDKNFVWNALSVTILIGFFITLVLYQARNIGWLIHFGTDTMHRKISCYLVSLFNICGSTYNCMPLLNMINLSFHSPTYYNYQCQHDSIQTFFFHFTLPMNIMRREVFPESFILMDRHVELFY